MIEWLATPHEELKWFALGGMIFLLVGAYLGWCMHKEN